MRGIVLFLIAAANAGCASPIEPPVIDPAFRTYYASFIEQAALHEKELSLGGLVMRFGDLPINEHGICDIDKVITIDQEVWFRYGSDWDRELLVFHELAHCTLGQRHRENSIMDPRTTGAAYALKRAEYLEELFSHD
jgi:hypothetical protein